jgi:hypothetical protein
VLITTDDLKKEVKFFLCLFNKKEVEFFLRIFSFSSPPQPESTCDLDSLPHRQVIVMVMLNVSIDSGGVG